MSIEQYLVPIQSRVNDLCFSCRRACGRCPWSARDPVTDEIRYEPIPGWTAEPAKLFNGRYKDRKKQYEDTWHITACPLYIPDGRSAPPTKRPASPPSTKRPHTPPRPVEKVDASGRVVAVYPNLKAAAKANDVGHSTMCDWCHGQVKKPHPQVGCGYRFRFKEEGEP